MRSPQPPPATPLTVPGSCITGSLPPSSSTATRTRSPVAPTVNVMRPRPCTTAFVVNSLTARTTLSPIPLRPHASRHSSTNRRAWTGASSVFSRVLLVCRTTGDVLLARTLGGHLPRGGGTQP